MKTVIVTGSCGLIGNEACYFFKNLGFRIVGIDNDMRKYFFGDKSSTSEKKDKTQKDLGDAYFHYDSDIRDLNLMEKIFSIATLAALGLILFAREIATVLADVKFHEALKVVPIVIIGYVFHQMYCIYGLCILAIKRKQFIHLL